MPSRASDDAIKRTRRSRSFKVADKLNILVSERSSSSKFHFLKLMFVIIVCGAIFTHLCTSTVHDEHSLQSVSRYVFFSWNPLYMVWICSGCGNQGFENRYRRLYQFFKNPAWHRIPRWPPCMYRRLFWLLLKAGILEFVHIQEQSLIFDKKNIINKLE